MAEAFMEPGEEDEAGLAVFDGPSGVLEAMAAWVRWLQTAMVMD